MVTVGAGVVGLGVLPPSESPLTPLPDGRCPLGVDVPPRVPLPLVPVDDRGRVDVLVVSGVESDGGEFGLVTCRFVTVDGASLVDAESPETTASVREL